MTDCILFLALILLVAGLAVHKRCDEKCGATPPHDSVPVVCTIFVSSYWDTGSLL